MAPGGEMIRYPPHFGENVLHHGSHEWLPYSKDEVRLKSSNNNLPGGVERRYIRLCSFVPQYAICCHITVPDGWGNGHLNENYGQKLCKVNKNRNTNS